jgi:hypothetical protein
LTAAWSTDDRRSRNFERQWKRLEGPAEDALYSVGSLG